MLATEPKRSIHAIMKSAINEQGSIEHRSQSEEVHTQARALIKTQRTMVLATQENKVPWTAPVYYVYAKPKFYFFSSPKARHIRQAGPERMVAASIYIDSDQWQEIQGLQMCGVLLEVKKSTERLKAVARFLVKFPFAKPFLQPETEKQIGTPSVGEKVRLYAFIPRETHFVNNRMGFGKRLSVTL